MPQNCTAIPEIPPTSNMICRCNGLTCEWVENYQSPPWGIFLLLAIVALVILVCIPLSKRFPLKE